MHRYTVSECEAACRNNPLCAGFNLPNGHMKTVDCDQVGFCRSTKS